MVNTLIDGGTTRTSSNNPVDWSTQDGWYVDLNPGNTSPGERINLDPQLVLGTLVVVGNVPNNSVCTVGGDAFVYFFDYKSGRNVVSVGGRHHRLQDHRPDGRGLRDLLARRWRLRRRPAAVAVVAAAAAAIDCYYTGATGEKIRYQCPIGGGGGKARRTSWRELIQRSKHARRAMSDGSCRWSSLVLAGLAALPPALAQGKGAALRAQPAHARGRRSTPA